MIFFEILKRSFCVYEGSIDVNLRKNENVKKIILCIGAAFALDASERKNVEVHDLVAQSSQITLPLSEEQMKDPKIAGVVHTSEKNLPCF